MTAVPEPSKAARRPDPMAPIDAAADRLFGKVAQQPPTLFGQIMLNGLRRAATLATIEVFGTSEQRASTHRMMDQMEQNRRERADG